jgi:hypothetical protein
MVISVIAPSKMAISGMAISGIVIGGVAMDGAASNWRPGSSWIIDKICCLEERAMFLAICSRGAIVVWAPIEFG